MFFFVRSQLNGTQRLAMLQVDNLIEVVNNFLRKSSNILQPSSRCLIKICCSLIKSTTSLIARLTETRAASWVQERHLIALKRGLETVNAISSIRKVHESLIIIIKLTKKLNPVLRAELIGEGEIKLHPRNHGVIPNCCASYHIRNTHCSPIWQQFVVILDSIRNRMLIILPDGPDGKIEDIVSTKTEYTCQLLGWAHTHFTSGLEDRKKSKFDRRQNCNYLRNATGKLYWSDKTKKRKTKSTNWGKVNKSSNKFACATFGGSCSRGTTGRNDCQFHSHPVRVAISRGGGGRGCVLPIYVLADRNEISLYSYAT